MGRLIEESRVVEILEQTWLSGTIAHRFIDDIKRRIRKEVPTVETISRADLAAILSKIRAEVKDLKRFEIRGQVTPLVNVDRVLAIIDNVENEGKE